ncbi:putative phosphonate transport system ATP-binding protein [Rhizobium sp. ERR 922]|uniref:ABC transporter ATP-binding protein n=1 Tax=Rhizobium dioscoreae TaxID=2653122 RepID=A0ABQ0Z0H5_9HYPH|nr:MULTISPECIES: ATP-binding cassette domain-containing protein [Rhizobium]MCZ3377000.1 ATP-binding cassette domain-containing protein [Rhizobium sp. AG207R]TWB12578.1 putative phosphonate transport system ATP-binding protein [Rhizobium sp. ERR1071]TWB58250.1 putative phosphonate transport system ATP-binding protein [Rhizobium sp. ERR 922]TWB99945.1 putative phosphonate transport system ATP-binding protein [Rhizobium sp. ERR 942]GES43577.1 ABC transporter ATP-binding protein [Rhizobium dioscor
MAALDPTQTAELTRQPPRLMLAEPILTMRGIARNYGDVTALGGVDVTVYPGEVLGIVGESGSGKSTLLRMMNLEDTPDTGTYNLALPGHESRDLFTLDRFERRMLRAHHIGIVYQNPHLGLLMNHTSSGNVAERLLISGNRNFAELRERARQSLDASEFPIERMDARPNELSGGMQQRVQLAKAIALEPAVLLLDEPTTGLDVSVQALVLDTLKRLQRERSITMVLVSHDLGVIRTMADRVMVMRRGKVVEQGLADQIFQDPQHAYTQQLVHAKL